MSNVHTLVRQATPDAAAALTPLSPQDLARLGIETGRWALRSQPVSGTPLLTYARELRTLEKRFGTVLTDRLRWQQRRHRLEAAWPEPECAELHAHDDLEIRVVLAGVARYAVAAGTDGGEPREVGLLEAQPGDWIALPAGLPHRLLSPAASALEVLRLFTRPRGWVARTVSSAPATADWAHAA